MNHGARPIGIGYGCRRTRLGDDEVAPLRKCRASLGFQNEHKLFFPKLSLNHTVRSRLHGHRRAGDPAAQRPDEHHFSLFHYATICKRSTLCKFAINSDTHWHASARRLVKFRLIPTHSRRPTLFQTYFFQALSIEKSLYDYVKHHSDKESLIPSLFRRGDTAVLANREIFRSWRRLCSQIRSSHQTSNPKSTY